jgi:ribosomal protein S1
MVMTSPGEAGGVAQDSFTVSAKVTEVEKKTRELELTSEDGSKTTFVAGPEIRNFDQIREGDTVTATVTERLVVFVRRDGEDPSVTHASALATAPKGAKPGATLAQSYEVTAKVTAIDSANRTAELTFSNGQSRTIPVRKDVELSRYKVGDTVVIRITEALTVLVKSS